MLEKRIDKFTETTTQQLLISNPESSEFVREELRKLSDKWQQFKDQVKNKRKSLDQATDFFEIIEKVSFIKKLQKYFINFLYFYYRSMLNIMRLATSTTVFPIKSPIYVIQ